jgi:DivIVA domain-containing protein
VAVVFALLVVAVIGIGVVVAVRSPGAGVLPEAGASGPVTVAPEGPLTAQDLRAIRFPIVFRGYRPAEVDALLERLERQLAPASAVAPLEDRAELPADGPDARQVAQQIPEQGDQSNLGGAQ